jgi:tetratricopeptide (TPR) repeat protein
MGNLAQVLVDREKLDEAERLVREAMRICEKVLGADSVAVADLNNSLGRVLTRRPQEAEAHFRKALAIHRKHYGDEHDAIAWDLDNLAVVLYEQRRLGEAETAVRQSLAIKRKVLGPVHPSTLQTQTNLGELLRERGELEPARELLQEAVELFLKTPAADPAYLANCRLNLGAVLVELRRFEEAAPELLAAYLALEKAGGRDHRLTRDAAAWLERLAARWPDAAFRARVKELLG